MRQKIQKKLILIFLIFQIKLNPSLIVETLIEEDIAFDMLQSCLLAYPNPIDIDKREICLLHISDYNSTISLYNKNQKMKTDNLYSILYDSTCLNLEQAQNINNGIPSISTCNNNLSQKWIIIKEGLFFKIQNSLYNKCLTLIQPAIANDLVKVRDCIDNDIEQRFTSSQSNSYSHIIIDNGLCIKNDRVENNYYVTDCTSSNVFNFRITRDFKIYNPFFKKSIIFDSSAMKIKNTNKDLKQIFSFLFINPVLNQYLILPKSSSKPLRVIPENINLINNTFGFTSIDKKFNLEFVKIGFFKIKSVNTSQCVSIDNFENEENGLVYMKNCETQKNQIWQFIEF